MSAPLPPSPPPRRYMSPTGRIVIPVLFVMLLIVVLGRPILISGLELDSEQTEPLPTTTEGPGKKPKAVGPSRLAAAYPKACLTDAPSPGLGLIAASDGVTVTGASPTGTDAFALQARPPIGFSASGSFLSTAGADLWTGQGRHIGLAFGDAVKSWAWSPIADCIAGLQDGRLVVAEADSRPVTLIDETEVTTFSFSADGTQILFATGGESRSSGLWIADLPTGKVRILQSSLGWNLVGWRGQQPVLFRDTSRPARDGLAFPPSDVVARCGKDVITTSKFRLAVVGLSGPSRYLAADRNFLYSSLACAPNGDLLVVVRAPKDDESATEMVLLSSDGTLVSEVAQQTRFEDGPMWGPSGTGVVFVGDPGGEGAVGPLVWFLPEGGAARPTGLRVDRPGEGLDALLDWSATPPLGHPTD